MELRVIALSKLSQKNGKNNQFLQNPFPLTLLNKTQLRLQLIGNSKQLILRSYFYPIFYTMVSSLRTIGLSNDSVLEPL